ncbi:MAG: collagen-binding domain-containing protein [Lachnospira eligens]
MLGVMVIQTLKDSALMERIRGGLTDVDVSDTVIFNAVNVTGNINIGEVCGIVVAPKADITLTSTCNGRAISKSFVNVNGQMHFISDNQQQETTQRKQHL